MRLDPQPRRPRQAQLVAEMLQRAVQQRRPVGAAERELIRGELPRVADGGVGQRLLAEPELRRPRHRDQLLRQGCADLEAYRPDAGYLEREHARGRPRLSTEGPGRLEVVEQARQPLPRSPCHASSPAPDMLHTRSRLSWPWEGVRTLV